MRMKKYHNFDFVCSQQLLVFEVISGKQDVAERKLRNTYLLLPAHTSKNSESELKGKCFISLSHSQCHTQGLDVQAVQLTNHFTRNRLERQCQCSLLLSYLCPWTQDYSRPPLAGFNYNTNPQQILPVEVDYYYGVTDGNQGYQRFQYSSTQ